MVHRLGGSASSSDTAYSQGAAQDSHWPESSAQTLADTWGNQKAEENLEQEREKRPGRKKCFSEKKTEQTKLSQREYNHKDI